MDSERKAGLAWEYQWRGKDDAGAVGDGAPCGGGAAGDDDVCGVELTADVDRNLWRARGGSSGREVVGGVGGNAAYVTRGWGTADLDDRAGDELYELVLHDSRVRRHVVVLGGVVGAEQSVIWHVGVRAQARERWKRLGSHGEFLLREGDRRGERDTEMQNGPEGPFFGVQRAGLRGGFWWG